MPRIACILVPNFPIAAIVRANPELHLAPFAISNTSAPHAELIAVSTRARKSGIYPAMTIAQARSIIPDLAVVNHSEAAETSAMDALADAAESISPLVEKGDDGRVWLDLAGLERLMGSEEAIAAELEKRVGQVGLECVDRHRLEQGDCASGGAMRRAARHRARPGRRLPQLAAARHARFG